MIDQPHVVVRRIRTRRRRRSIAELEAAGTSTVHEAIGRRGFVGPDIRPIQQGVRLAGSAVTVSSHPGDNLMIHAAVEVCSAGDVLVVTNTAPSTHGMFGELLASSLIARGVRGLVIDAGVRDTHELRQLGFPVWSRHVSCQGTVKASPGSVNVPVVLGGVAVAPGDVVCADDDGVVVVPSRRGALGSRAVQSPVPPRSTRPANDSSPVSWASTSTASATSWPNSASSMSTPSRSEEMRVAVFGLGEAGALFAADLCAAGIDVSAFDPAPMPTPDGRDALRRPSNDRGEYGHRPHRDRCRAGRSGVRHDHHRRAVRSPRRRPVDERTRRQSAARRPRPRRSVERSPTSL